MNSIRMHGDKREAIRLLSLVAAIGLCLALAILPAAAEDEQEAGEQSRESMANDSTAAQWSYQIAYEWRDWRDDTLSNGMTRPPGNQNMWQLRIVAPFKFNSLTLLPRVTLRNNEAVDKSSGAGDAEVFALIIPNATDWGSGRWGIGPQINFPAEDTAFGSTVWRYGFATAALQQSLGGKILWGGLVQQLWGETDPMDRNNVKAQPITIQPVFNYSIKNGYYINIGETAFSYDWDASAWLIPLGVRFGKLWIRDDGTLNLYFEYRTTVIYDDWPGSALKNAYRINLSYTVPVGAAAK